VSSQGQCQIDGGGGVGVAVALFLEGDTGMGRAVTWRMVRTWDGRRAGSASRTSATMPAVSGVAIRGP